MIDPVFLFGALGAVLVAVAFTIAPLLRDRARTTALALAVTVPLLTVALYLTLGTPRAIEPDTGGTGEVRRVLTDLAREAMGDPENAERWLRLGLAYKRLEEFDSAEHALRRALYLRPDEPFLQVELAETLLFASGEPILSEEARELLERANRGSPNQKALWLLGLDAFERESFDRAAAHLGQLVSLLPADSSVAPTVREYLDRARRNAGLETASADADDSLRLQVDISIDPELQAALSGEETVFLIVRRPGGGGPPIAVRRFSARQLPIEATVDQRHAMIPGGFPDDAEALELVARVSSSGEAMPRAGDLEGSARIAPGENTRAEVAIDRRR